MPVERVLATLTAADGVAHDALLHHDPAAERRRARAGRPRTAIVHVHGIMGNFLVGTLRFLPAPVARSGVAVLVADTRMGNLGQITGDGLWTSALADLDAAWRFLADRGYERIVLSGYSSGATLATLMAATSAPDGLAGLISLAGPWGLPQAMRQRAHRFGSDPPYHLIVERVAALAELPDDEQAERDRVFVVERSRGPTRQPRDSEIYTARTWWNSRGPAADTAMAYRHIGAVRAPVLLLQGQSDHVVHPDEAEELARQAQLGGNRSVRLVRIDGVDHDFGGAEMRVIEAVTGWLSELG